MSKLYSVVKTQSKTIQLGTVENTIIVKTNHPILAGIKAEDFFLISGRKWYCRNVSVKRLLDKNSSYDGEDKWLLETTITAKSYDAGSSMNQVEFLVNKPALYDFDDTKKLNAQAAQLVAKSEPPPDPSTLIKGNDFAYTQDRKYLVFYFAIGAIPLEQIPSNVEKVWADGKLIFNRAWYKEDGEDTDLLSALKDFVSADRKDSLLSPVTLREPTKGKQIDKPDFSKPQHQQVKKSKSGRALYLDAEE